MHYTILVSRITLICRWYIYPQIYWELILYAGKNQVAGLLMAFESPSIIKVQTGNKHKVDDDMKITRKFMIYVVCTGIILFTMALVFLYSSFTHIDVLKQLIHNNFPIKSPSSPSPNTIQAIHASNGYHDLLAPLFFLIATIGLMMLVIQLIYILKRIVTPITEAAEFSYKLAKGYFPSRMNFNNRQCDEIISLIKSLNFMRDRLQSAINKLKLSHKREKDIRAEVEKANRIQSDFIANVSSDLRNPLNAIKGWTELMLQDIATGKADIHLTDRLKMINNNIAMLDNQITGLLDIAELHSEYDMHNLSSFNPVTFMNELVDYNLIRFKNRNLAMENHFSTRVPDKIMTDRDLLFSIIDAIIGAIIEESSGKIKISYGCSSAGGTIYFWIQPDFESNELNLLVKKFEQYSTYPVSKLPTIKGVAILNLLIAAGRAKKLHAQFKIDSQDNKHVFKLCFNSTDIETDEIIGKTPLLHVASNVSNELPEYMDDLLPEKYPQPYKLNVLIADHDQDNNAIITQFLEAAGCRTVAIHNSECCHNIMDGKDYDVAILDRKMVEQLFNADATECLLNKPVIITTSYLNEMQRRKFMGLGINYFFIKPLDFNKLTLVVAALGMSDKVESDQ